jgi:NTE family protein
LSLALLFPLIANAQENPTPPVPDAQSPNQSTTQSAPPSPAQAPTKRLKIGVALEGGGALGLAHIGVLQWFEDHHIPIDYVAGTSMGGLVGGLYATGKSPKELQEIVERQKWDTIIGGRTPYDDLSFRRKEDQQALPNYLLLGLKKGLTLPGGLNAGQRIGLLIDHETLAYSQLKSFSDLPTPFRCVATDLVTGKEVIFSDGDLATAMRATMSIPGLFTPVRTDGHVYVDGGLVGNLPTDVVRKMGADIVVGIHLETAPADEKDIQSLFSVLGRSIDVIIRENEIRGLAGADMVVSVNLKDFTSLDYEKSETIIQKGKAAAEGKQNVLDKLKVTDHEWQEFVATRDSRKKIETVVPQSIEVRGVQPNAQGPILKFLKPLIGHPLDRPQLDQFLTRLTGVGKFDTAGYRVETRDDGQQALVVILHEQIFGPPTLQPGFEVDGSESKDVTFTQAARLTFMDVAGYRSEWRTDFLFGNTYGLATELYRPFNPTSRWFFSPHVDASSSGLHVYSRNDPIAIYGLDRANGGIDIGYGFSRFMELRAGYSVGYLDASLRLGAPEFGSVNGRIGETRVRFRIDHGDDPVVPRKGYTLDANFHWYDSYPESVAAFPAGDVSISGFLPITKAGSLFATFQGGTIFGHDSGGFPLYFLGGPTHLSAYGTNELFGDQFYLVRTGYLHELLTLPNFIGKKVYAIGALETAHMSDFPLPESSHPFDADLGILAETAIGPFFFGGSVGDSGHRKWFFQLGRIF